MIPRSLCPIDNADHLSLSYPPSRSLRFRVNAPVPALNGKMPKGSDEQQFGLSIFDLKSRRDMVLGGLPPIRRRLLGFGFDEKKSAFFLEVAK